MNNEQERSIAFKDLRFPLQYKVFILAFLSALLFGLITLIVSFTLYTISLVDQYIGMSYAVAGEAAVYVEDAFEPEPLMTEVMDIYRSIPEEDLASGGYEAFSSRFAHIKEYPEYIALRKALHKMYKATEVDDVYIGMYDRETSRLIYLCDPDTEMGEGYEPGFYETVEEREIDKFLDWDGHSELHDTSNTDRYGWMCTGGYPIYDDNGETVCFVLADVTMHDLYGRMFSFCLYFILASVLLILGLTFYLNKNIERTLVTPIRSIADAAIAYTEDTEKGLIEDDHFGGLDIRTGDEVEVLSHVMARMEDSLKEYEESLAVITAERERVNTEMSLAKRIQADMLPNIFPPFPDRSEFDLYASMDPAREIGGDFYNYFLIDDDHLCLMIADVSGKGIPAALFMMASMIILSDRAGISSSPAEILRTANDLICSNDQAEMFVTAWLGIMEISTGRMLAANAGHEYPFLSDGSGHFELLKDPHGFVLGGLPNRKYHDYEVKMQHGSKLFLYTDGVTEATNADGELFGTDNLLQALNSHPNGSPKDTITAIKEATDSFVGEADQFDDLTMLCIEYR